ncbi:MAG: amino acid racemase [Candidatus Aminicenantes bacterium]|nr:amino acid racemase [Candidatus Aminicenantes bacterium]
MTAQKKGRSVGILGGMGVYATLDFLTQVFNFTPNRKHWGNLRIIIDNAISIPNIIQAVLFNGPDPRQAIIDSIHNCEKIGAEFIAVPCNSVHYYYEDIIPHINIPWINIVEIASREAKKIGKTPLVLGGLVTVEKKIYTRFIPGAVYPTLMENDAVINSIEEIAVSSRLNEHSKEEIRNIIMKYKEKISSVILACTELSIVFKNKYILGTPVIDSNLEYAKEVVKWSMKKKNNKKDPNKKK